MLYMALVLFISQVYGYGWQWETYPPTKSGAFYGTAPSCDGHCETPNIYLWFSGLSEGDGNLCTSGSKVYCNSAPNVWASTQWKGSAPSCGASCSDCSPGYCIASDQAGDGAVCFTGRKVLCGGTGPPQFRRLLEKDGVELELVNTADIEMGFIFKSNSEDKEILVSADSDDHFKQSVVEFLSEVNLYGTSSNACSVLGERLIDPYTYMVNVKFDFDTVTNAEKVNKFLDEANNDEISRSIHNKLKMLAIGYDNIDIQFVEAKIGSKYINGTKLADGGPNEMK